jgi:acyl-coenzyme A thioesterase PaaI-like protein
MMKEREMARQVYGIWTETVAELMSYRYLGCRSVLGDGFRASGRMPLRSDMHFEGSLLAAPVAIAMLDTAGIAVDRHWQLALTHVEVNFSGVSSGVATLGVDGAMTRQARSQIFTEARFFDLDNPERLVGVGTADWTVIASTATGFDYIDPGPGVPDTGDLPALASAYGAVPRASGGFVIEDLTPRLGGLVLHHGPILVTLEAAALAEAGAGVRIEALSVRIVKAGKRGPFIASATTLTDAGDTVLVRADLHQDGDTPVLIATATVRLHRRGDQ